MIHAPAEAEKNIRSAAAGSDKTMKFAAEPAASEILESDGFTKCSRSRTGNVKGEYLKFSGAFDRCGA